MSKGGPTMAIVGPPLLCILSVAFDSPCFRRVNAVDMIDDRVLFVGDGSMKLCWPHLNKKYLSEKAPSIAHVGWNSRNDSVFITASSTGEIRVNTVEYFLIINIFYFVVMKFFAGNTVPLHLSQIMHCFRCIMMANWCMMRQICIKGQVLFAIMEIMC